MDRLHPQSLDTLRRLIDLHGAKAVELAVRELAKRDRTFPIADYEKLPLEMRQGRYAVLTGELRAPRKGEWYVSGALPAAYQAPNDLSMTYRIAKFVK